MHETNAQGELSFKCDFCLSPWTDDRPMVELFVDEMHRAAGDPDPGVVQDPWQETLADPPHPCGLPTCGGPWAAYSDRTSRSPHLRDQLFIPSAGSIIVIVVIVIVIVIVIEKMIVLIIVVVIIILVIIIEEVIFIIVFIV